MPFLVLEPAKQEYRALAMIDGMEDLCVFSPGADTRFPLHINPFQFPVGLTLAEHIANLNAVFAGGGVPDDAPTFTCAHGENSAPSAFLADAGLVKSRGEAKRLIKEGALSIDGQRCDDALSPLAAGEYVIKLGKKRFLRLTVEG